MMYLTTFCSQSADTEKDIKRSSLRLTFKCPQVQELVSFPSSERKPFPQSSTVYISTPLGKTHPLLTEVGSVRAFVLYVLSYTGNPRDKMRTRVSSFFYLPNLWTHPQVSQFSVCNPTHNPMTSLLPIQKSNEIWP